MTTEIYEGEHLLRGKTVFLSASKPSRSPDRFPASDEVELEEGVRCLARAVFAEGGHLVFGAHPSISPLIVDVATEYFPPDWQAGSRKERPVSIYQSKAFRDVIPAATRDLESLGYARIEMTDAVNGETAVFPPPPHEQCQSSLAHMRQRMFTETSPVAMVAAGGMEGVIREAKLFLETCQGNVYFLAKSGGACEKMLLYLESGIAPDVQPVFIPNWRPRVIAIEDRFGEPHWGAYRGEHAYLPDQPYALLMQKVVRHIAGKVE